MPRLLRVGLVCGVIALATGIGVFSYKYLTRPVTLTVATGSVYGDSSRLISAMASRLVSSSAPIRLRVTDFGTPLAAARAFSAGEVDLALVRADTADLSAARAVVLISSGVLLIIVPSDSSIASVKDLNAKTIGVVGKQTNQRVVDALDREYDLGKGGTRFEDLATADVQRALQSKHIDALLLVIPIAGNHLSIIRSLFPREANGSPKLIPIEAAAAIAAAAPYYESYDLPKGTVRGSPPIPEDDLPTLRVAFYLVANSKLSDDLISDLTKAVMDARMGITEEHPRVAQISAPSTDTDATIPIHPGAAAYFSGDVKTIFDKYGDRFFYGSMILGMLGSIVAAVWRFMLADGRKATERSSQRLLDLIDQIHTASSEADLDKVEEDIDAILKTELSRSRRDDADAAALNIALNRLAYLINGRRKTLEG